MTQPASWLDLMEQGAPELMKVVTGTRESILPDGALSNKTKTLMTMLCDALLGHDGGVTTIANRARAAGASEEELRELMVELVEVQFAVEGLELTDELFESSVDEGLETMTSPWMQFFLRLMFHR